MRNVWSIIKNDFRMLTSSVVTIVILIGLCIIPCLYAWFNIFSNWDPYVPASTGRIAVAVVNEDKGADMLGLNVNVGEKITEELKANDDIGWKFVKNSDKAIEGLRAGDYYAAVIIPEDFSSDILSFTSGDPVHPQLDYYENVKKNAIAPKITEKARQALQEEIDAAFVGTIGKYISEAAAIANATGLDPRDVFSDLSDRVGLLGERMDDLVAVVTAAQGLSDAANKLMKATDRLAGSTQDALSTGEKVLDQEEAALPQTGKDAKAVSASIRKEATTIADGLDLLYSALSKAASDMDSYNDFVVKDLDAHKTLVGDMAGSAADVAKKLRSLGLNGMAARFQKLSDRLMQIYNALDALEVADETTWPQIQKAVNDLLADIRSASDISRSIAEDAGKNLDSKIDKTISDTRKAIRQIRSTLENSYSDLDNLSSALAGSEKAMKSLNSGLDVSVEDLLDMQTGFRSLSELFESLADSDALADVNYLISDGTDVIAKYLGSPIRMNTEVIYPIRNFGSMMASFYTVLAQWVGALFAAVLIRARLKRREEEEGIAEPGLLAQFIGRYRLFLMVGLAQALIVSLGDLLYVGIQCEHPILFVIAACVNGVAFTMINYALCFALGKVGAGVSVIILLIQVAGGGGTFPPEVLPGIFRHIYPFMPFHYAMDAMKECVAGMYDHRYLISILIVLLAGLIAGALGLLLVKPMERLIRMITNSLEESDLMEG